MKKIFLILAICGIGFYAYKTMQPQQTMAQRPKAIPNVVVAYAKLMPIRDEVEAIGTGKANESITVTSKITEVVTEINFEDGDLVPKDKVLVQLQDAEQQAKVNAAKVKLKEHLREFERISSLVTSKTVAELERDRLQSLIDSARAELDQANSALTDRAISSPFAGRLGLRQVSVGSLVSTGEKITTLDDVSKIKLDFSVPERFIQQLQAGKLVEASAVAFPGRVFKGEVTSIDSRVNPATRAVMVRAIIPNDDLALLPGMLMKVKLIKQSREGLLLPESAIIPIQDKHYIYSTNQDNEVIQIEVKLGVRMRGWVEIVDGLSVGEQVLIRGILKVRPGDKVTIQEAENFNFVQIETAEKSA
ncbi:efflux RND transporter periplasmic adaptor subunit [Shewanella aestuarii]|uniref:Efflux RND transporter periplasmic adaptor subunit n=1 Tax=Shewanella aestuarii TaxID=1028752 RepID=A0A6G9QKT9_9GAMM|nr:efflux RND transporter periplasmic adaptor subunit [Shewanella aestuarii]QIR14461.1 efflux RND transporter periplasmic adaptor subunit [Shewanella aestuarii]